MPRQAGTALVLGLLAAALPAAAQEPVDVPYTKYVLDNGLRLIVHEDHKAPIVAVNVWYDVGAADEAPGKTGFAHLFEHLMFNGSEHFNDDYFKPFDRVGATGMNGTTNQDRTNYFQVVPTTALDMALWMESDRMAHMLGAVDQARLDEQRGVVRNEKRQGENQPYGKVFLTIFENTYPDGHPYDHSTIGSMDDLNAASLDDVRAWFETWYGAANAVLVVAGDVDPEDVRTRVERYFGHVPPGPPLVKPDVNLARRTEESRIVLQDRVPQARVYRAWNVAALGDPALDHLGLAGDVLAAGRSSRLSRRLVYEDQIATDVSAFVLERQFGSLFILQATAQPGQDLAAVEAALDEELRSFLADGPAAGELARAQAGRRASFVRGVERIGGFGGKSDVLAASEVYLGSPDGHKRTQKNILTATPADVRAAAVEWLRRGALTVEVRPFPAYAAAESGVDRSSGPPAVTEFPAASFPARETTRLSNGLEVILARRTAVPVVDFNLLLDAGYAADQFALPGTARMALDMLDEGTTSRTALEIAETLEGLGTTLAARSGLDTSSVTMSTLKENLDASLDLFADVVLRPSFPETEFDRRRRQQLATIAREVRCSRRAGDARLPAPALRRGPRLRPAADRLGQRGGAAGARPRRGRPPAPAGPHDLGRRGRSRAHRGERPGARTRPGPLPRRRRQPHRRLRSIVAFPPGLPLGQPSSRRAPTTIPAMPTSAPTMAPAWTSIAR